MHSQQKKSTPHTPRSFVSESGSPIEKLIVTYVCEPLVPHIPERLHPNYISLLAFVLSWLSALLAIISVHVSNPGKSLALIGAGICLFLVMVGDCLDGMHARYRGLASKRGEIIDHTLDSITVPLIAASLAYALHVPDWALILIAITAAMIYHAQLILYHFTGQFLSPGLYTGTVGQLFCAIAYVGAALVFALTEHTTGWYKICITAASVGWIISQLHCCVFYYKRLGTLIINHLQLILYCSFFAALFRIGSIPVYVFILGIVCISFRLSGRYVMYTVLQKPCPAGDTGIVIGIIVMSVLLLLGIENGLYLQGALYILYTYMIMRTMSDMLLSHKALQ